LPASNVNTAGPTNYHKGPQRTITKHRNGPLGAARVCKEPQGSQTKDYKGLLGTAKVCKELHRILKVVVILINVTLICRPIL